MNLKTGQWKLNKLKDKGRKQWKTQQKGKKEKRRKERVSKSPQTDNKDHRLEIQQLH